MQSRCRFLRKVQCCAWKPPFLQLLRVVREEFSNLGGIERLRWRYALGCGDALFSKRETDNERATGLQKVAT